MNVIELLKEARKQLAVMHDHLMELSAKLPMQYFGLVDSGLIQNTGNLLTRITAALAEPEPDAMEVVEKIRYPKYTQIDATTSSMTWFTDDQAAALLVSYGRRVPSALFDEIIQIQPLSYAKLGRAFVKHGVKVEG